MCMSKIQIAFQVTKCFVEVHSKWEKVQVSVHSSKIMETKPRLHFSRNGQILWLSCLHYFPELVRYSDFLRSRLNFFQEWLDTRTFSGLVIFFFSGMDRNIVLGLSPAACPLFSKNGKILGLSQASSSFFQEWTDTRTFSCSVSFIYQEWTDTQTFSGNRLHHFPGMDRYSEFFLARLHYFQGINR